MRCKTTFAQTADGNPADNARAAARGIHADFSGFDPSFVVFFAAVDYDPGVIAAEMQAAFPGAVTMGCSAAGEACDEKSYDRSVVAMAFSRDAFAFSETAIILADKSAAAGAARADVFSDTTDALRYLARDLDKPLLDLDYREYIALMLGDATNTFTEGIIERAGELMNVFLAGGIAADLYTFDKQAVFYKGEAYQNGAAVVALWKPKNGFELLKTQAVELTETQLTITRADEENRIIWEFDGRPAMEAYSEAIGIPEDKIGIPEFESNALALVVDRDPFLRAGIGTVEGGGIRMYMRVVQGTRVTLTKGGKFVGTTEKVLAGKIAEMGHAPAGILHINCVCRYKALRDAGQFDAFGRIFTDIPHISFASMGEICINIVGFTSVMILFK